MKPKNALRRFLAIAGSSLLAVSSAHALDGTWSVSTGAATHNWTLNTMWVGNQIADGGDYTANFTGIDITGAKIVSLNGTNRTIGNITFTDTTSSNKLTISGNILTLDRTLGAVPVIDVTNQEIEITSTLAGNDGLVKTGAGGLRLIGTNNLTGGITIKNGSVISQNAVNNFGANKITLGDAANTGTTCYIVVLSNSQTYNNAIDVRGNGVNTIYNYSAGSSAGSTWSGAINLGGNLRFRDEQNPTGGANIISGVISGTGNFTLEKRNDSVTGSTLTLSNANTFTGKTTITSGILSLTNLNSLQYSYIDTTASATGDGNDGLRTNQTTLNLGGLSGNKDLASIFTTVVVGGGYNSVTAITLDVATVNNLDYSGAITGSRSLTKTGAGTQVFSGSNGYTGLTTISAGTLTLGHATNTLADTAAVNVNGGTLALGTNTDTVGAVTLTSGSITGSGAGTLTGTSYAVQSGSVSAKLGGAVALTKTTTGTVILSGSNTYTGTTTLSTVGGVLQANDGTGLPSASFLSLDGGVLQSNGVSTFTRALAASGASKLQFTANGGGFSARDGQLTVNLGGAAAEQVWGNTVGSELVGTLQFGSTTANNKTLFENPIDLNTANRTIHVTAGVGNDLAEISGVIRTSSGTAGLIKTGNGTLRLTNANTYNGATDISGGTLELSGASGAITSSSEVSIASGATLLLSNTPANHINRLNGTGTMSMAGGTLNFAHTAGDALYSENTRPMTVTGTNNKIIASRAADGKTSTLNLAELTYSGGANALQFVGEDLGLADQRNRILIGGTVPLTNQVIGGNATYFDSVNGISGEAGYDTVRGVVLKLSDAGVSVRGGMIPNNAAFSVGIINGGDSGSMFLQAAVTTVQSLTQNAGDVETETVNAGTVNLAGGTLRANSVIIGNRFSPLTIGQTPGDGELMPSLSGGLLTLNNDYVAAPMTINAKLAANGIGSSLTKTGVGTLVLAGAATYTGATAIQGGTLQLAGANRLPTGTVLTLGAGGTSGVLKLDGNNQTLGGLTTDGGGTGNRVVNGSAGAATLTLGGSLTFGGVLGGAEGSPEEVKVKENNFSLIVSGSPTLTGSNTFTGGVTLNGGTLNVSTVANTGTPQPLGAGTSPITFTAAATLAITGDGSTDCGLVLGDHANTLSVADGKTVAMSGNIAGGGTSAYFYKTGEGTFNYSGSGAWNGHLYIQEGTVEISGTGKTPGLNSDGIGETRLTDSSALHITSSTASLSTSKVIIGFGTTVELNAGTLRTNAMTKTGTFTWGGGTLATVGNIAMGTVDRTGDVDEGGAPSGPVVMEGNILSYTGDLANASGSTLDLGSTYLDLGVRYNQLKVSGILTLNGGTLNLGLNPGSLRPTSPNSVETGDWGTLILVYADTITGQFVSITGIGNDGIGWSREPDLLTTNPDPENPGPGFNPFTLDINTYRIEYRTGYGSLQAGGDAILLHYRVAGSVPEPGAAGLVLGGALLLRAFRRRANGAGQPLRPQGQRRGMRLRRRSSRSRSRF